MERENQSKIAIIGMGLVGSSVAYTLAINQAANEMVLIDIDKDKASGEADDIKSALCFAGGTNIYAGDYEDIKDCSIIIITAGLGRKPGETRLDLAQKNSTLFQSITENIMKYYNKGVIIVVSNPVDILTYLVTKWSGLPSDKVIGTGTLLDSARFRSALSDLTNIDVKNIHGYILGEHGDSQVAAWSSTHIAGVPIDEYCSSNHIELNDQIKSKIQNNIITSGASIIRRKGATYYGIAVCVSNLVETIMHNKNTIRTISMVLDGQFGLSDVAISLPAIVNASGAKRALEPKLTPEEQNKLILSADSCKQILNGLKVLN